jgi:hypothetical protein
MELCEGRANGERTPGYTHSMSDATKITCVRCRGVLWICEAHPDCPWPHDGCRGAGDPCPVCNGVDVVEDPPGFNADVKADG